MRGAQLNTNLEWRGMQSGGKLRRVENMSGTDAMIPHQGASSHTPSRDVDYQPISLEHK